MSEREAFEEAAARLGCNLTMAEHEAGEYKYPVTQTAWDLWQEATEQAARAAEAVEFTCHGRNAPAYNCSKPGDMSGTYYTHPAKPESGEAVATVQMDNSIALMHRPYEMEPGTELYAHLAKPESGVPEGWKLVPEFSHSDMDVAAHDTGIIDRFQAETIWSVMVAAAPQPPINQESGDE